MSRVFEFDAEKALQAAAFLLRREPGRRMNYMRLLKILYIAERESLAETGKPLTGSCVIAMERGPVLEDILRLIRGQHLATPRWSQFFRVQDFHLEMLADPGVDRLSKFTAGKLDEVAVRHRGDDEWQLVEITHQLPEWDRNNPGKSSKEIPLEHILQAVGRGDELQKIIENCRRDARAAAFSRSCAG